MSKTSPSSTRLRAGAKAWIRTALPLSFRKKAAILIGRQRWIGAREWLAAEAIRDLAEKDPREFHQFLWENHLAYAASYEPEERFGEEHLHPSRQLLFDELLQALADRQMTVEEVESVYEVGCSLGYLLRHLETSIFTSAKVFEGSDIDRYATRVGSERLAAEGSRVVLRTGCMTQLDNLMEGEYDVILCAGVLMYLPQAEAEEVVRAILRRSRGIVAFAGLAHAATDNRTLSTSIVRRRDGSFIHNIDAMVENAGGKVVRRRWDGARSVHGNTIYFVFCVAGAAADDPLVGAA